MSKKKFCTVVKYIGIIAGSLAILAGIFFLGYHLGNTRANSYEFISFDSEEAEEYLEPAPIEFADGEAMDFCGRKTSVLSFLLYASYAAHQFEDEYGTDIWQASVMPDESITVEEGFIRYTADAIIYIQTCEAMYDMFKEEGLITISDQAVQETCDAIATETLDIINDTGLTQEASEVLTYDTVYEYELSLYKASAAYELFDEQGIDISEWITALVNDTDNPFTYARSMNWDELRNIKFVDSIM